jgi:hypothetical protein
MSLGPSDRRVLRTDLPIRAATFCADGPPGEGRAGRAIWAGHVCSDDPRGDPCTPVGRIANQSR